MHSSVFEFSWKNLQQFSGDNKKKRKKILNFVSQQEILQKHLHIRIWHSCMNAQ